MPVTPLRPSDPAQVGRHRLLGRLGQGGMGTVYLGVSPDERAVAVKVLRDGFADPHARGRFRHELDALRRVRGPHLVEVLDADVDAETPYLVTRFVPGTRLDDLVTRHGPLPPSDLHRLARGLADALAALHAAGVVHRDLTPGNVLVLDGQPHVIDLGLATAADVTAFTRSGLVIGTPGYLAPEQVTGSAVDEAVDVHAWGATVALAGTGRPPYGTGRPEAVLYRIVHGEPDLEGLPEPLAGLVVAAMDRDPTRRPRAGALLQALGGSSDAEPVTVHLPRDVDATAVLRTAALSPEDADVAAQEAITAPGRALATASSGPRAVLPPPPADPSADDQDTGPQSLWSYGQERESREAWPTDRDPHDEGPYDEEAGWHDDLPPPPRRHPAREVQAVLTGTAAVAVLGATTLVAPVVGATLALLALVLLRAVCRSQDRLRDRRERRGGRRSDPVVATLGAPWHLALAALDTVLSLPLLALAAAVPAGVVWLTSPNVPGLERPELTAAVAVVTALVTGLGRRVHRPSRRMLRSGLVSATPGAAGAVVVVGVLSAVALLLLATAEGAAPTWWPVQAVDGRLP